MIFEKSFWKIDIGSRKKMLLENWYLFDEQTNLPGKNGICSKSEKSSEKGGPGRKEQIFSKIISVAATAN